MARSYGALPDTRSKLIKVFLVAGLPLFWLVSILLSQLDASTFYDLNAEDGPIENLQVLVLLAACLVSGAILWNLLRQNQRGWAFFYALVCLGLFFLAGEEISWGQRIFGAATPDWFLQYNQQREISVHNLRVITNVMQRSADVVAVLLVIISAASVRIRPATRERWCAGLWMPPPIFIPAWLCFASYRGARIYHAISHLTKRVPPILSRLQEPAELILYIGALAFVVMVLMQVRRVPKSA